MQNAYEVIAEMETPGAARAVQGMLQEQGIAAVLSDDTASEELSSIVGHHAYALVQVRVPPEDVERALQILQTGDNTTIDENWEEAAESAIAGWICRGCDTVVDNAESICPECGTLRSEPPPEDDSAE